jgi:hypothetical protein
MSKIRVTNNMGQFITDAQNKAARDMTAALILGQSEAASMTPIDTSTLINSAFKNVENNNGRITGTAGYTAAYALAVHEAPGKLKGQPRRDFGKTRAGVSFGGGTGQGNYWDPTGEPQFLKKGFEQAADNIKAVLIGAIKV